MEKKFPWYKNAVFYELNVRAFYDSNGDGIGDIKGVIQKMDYLEMLGVDCIWLLPIYPSPLKDDGYDIADYYGIHPDYGTLEDFKNLIEEAHSRNIRVVTDLVLNHTSDQHHWFQSARADRNSPYRNYYVWSDTDQKYSETRIIFLDTEKSNWTWDPIAGQFFWHRFYSSQPDLNYDSPELRAEIFNIMRYWLDLGVDGFRADAVPYLYEREGTNCENLPETHAFLKEIRQYLDQHYPDKILLCEANQWPEDVRPYFGDGDEFHMGFHFPVMPRIYMALRSGDITPVKEILNRTPEIPPDCQWCTFLRNHDELTLEMVTEEERQWMWQEYAPDPRMRLNLGIRRRLAPLLDNDIRKIMLANSLLFTLPGSPILYYGDEIGMGDNIWLPDRNGVRTPMQWNNQKNAGFSDADSDMLYAPIINDASFPLKEVNVETRTNQPDSIWHQIHDMIQIRKKNPGLGLGEFSWLPIQDNGIAVYKRQSEAATWYIINNLTAETKTITLPAEVALPNSLADQLTGKAVSLNRLTGQLNQITLYSYQFLWLKAG